jgi:hypothetical protein
MRYADILYERENVLLWKYLVLSKFASRLNYHMLYSLHCSFDGYKSPTNQLKRIFQSHEFQKITKKYYLVIHLPNIPKL